MGGWSVRVPVCLSLRRVLFVFAAVASLPLDGCGGRDPDVGVIHQAAQAPPTIVQSLQRCLPGRCAVGQVQGNRMPPYNLGTGYTCDALRSETYSACMRQ